MEYSIKKPVNEGRRYSTPEPETSTLLECDKKLRSRGKEGEDMGASGRRDGIGRQLRGEMGHDMNMQARVKCE